MGLFDRFKKREVKEDKLYGISYEPTKNQLKKINERFEKSGSAMVPVGNIGFAFTDVNEANKLCEKLNQAHEELMYTVFELTDTYFGMTIEEKNIVNTVEEYDKRREEQHNEKMKEIEDEREF